MHHCADACTTMYLWSFNIYFHQTFCYFNLLTELSKSNDKKRGKKWFNSERPPLPTPNSCLCFDLFHPLRTSRCFSGPPLFLVKGSFIWEKSPISDQRFALMQIFINLRGRCGLYSSLPFWWELNLIPYCGLYGGQQWPVFLPVSVHNQRDPIK